MSFLKYLCFCVLHYDRQ